MFKAYGAYYWTSPIEGRLWNSSAVAIVGGGNSAAQAAVFLAEHASRVHIFTRGLGVGRDDIEQQATLAKAARQRHVKRP